MARPRKGLQIEAGGLNITATPHPPGIYLQLLQRAAQTEVQLWGSDYGKITDPKRQMDDGNIYRGLILIWTVIDREGDWIDKKQNKAATITQKSEINIPEELEPNFRAFQYALIESKHRVVVEYKNDLGQGFGPARAKAFFERLFSQENLGPNWPEVAVTVIPEDSAVDRLLHIPRLKKVEIHLQRPNPDDLTDDAARLLRELEEQGAKSQDRVLKKAAGVDTLRLNEENTTLARVAAINGYVTATGSDGDGNLVEESTRSHPRRILVDVPDGEYSSVRFLYAIASFG